MRFLSIKLFFRPFFLSLAFSSLCLKNGFSTVIRHEEVFFSENDWNQFKTKLSNRLDLLYEMIQNNNRYHIYATNSITYVKKVSAYSLCYGYENEKQNSLPVAKSMFQLKREEISHILELPSFRELVQILADHIYRQIAYGYLLDYKDQLIEEAIVAPLKDRLILLLGIDKILLDSELNLPELLYGRDWHLSLYQEGIKFLRNLIDNPDQKKLKKIIEASFIENDRSGLLKEICDNEPELIQKMIDAYCLLKYKVGASTICKLLSREKFLKKEDEKKKEKINREDPFIKERFFTYASTWREVVDHSYELLNSNNISDYHFDRGLTFRERLHLIREMVDKGISFQTKDGNRGLSININMEQLFYRGEKNGNLALTNQLLRFSWTEMSDFFQNKDLKFLSDWFTNYYSDGYKKAMLKDGLFYPIKKKMLLIGIIKILFDPNLKPPRLFLEKEGGWGCSLYEEGLAFLKKTIKEANETGEDRLIGSIVKQIVSNSGSELFKKLINENQEIERELVRTYLFLNYDLVGKKIIQLLRSCHKNFLKNFLSSYGAEMGGWLQTHWDSLEPKERQFITWVINKNLPDLYQNAINNVVGGISYFLRGYWLSLVEKDPYDPYFSKFKLYYSYLPMPNSDLWKNVVNSDLWKNIVNKRLNRKKNEIKKNNQLDELLKAYHSKVTGFKYEPSKNELKVIKWGKEQLLTLKKWIVKKTLKNIKKLNLSEQKDNNFEFLAILTTLSERYINQELLSPEQELSNQELLTQAEELLKSLPVQVISNCLVRYLTQKEKELLVEPIMLLALNCLEAKLGEENIHENLFAINTAELFSWLSLQPLFAYFSKPTAMKNVVEHLARDRSYQLTPKEKLLLLERSPQALSVRDGWYGTQNYLFTKENKTIGKKLDVRKIPSVTFQEKEAFLTSKQRNNLLYQKPLTRRFEDNLAGVVQKIAPVAFNYIHQAKDYVENSSIEPWQWVVGASVFIACTFTLSLVLCYRLVSFLKKSLFSVTSSFFLLFRDRLYLPVKKSIYAHSSKKKKERSTQKEKNCPVE